MITQIYGGTFYITANNATGIRRSREMGILEIVEDQKLDLTTEIEIIKRNGCFGTENLQWIGRIKKDKIDGVGEVR